MPRSGRWTIAGSPACDRILSGPLGLRIKAFDVGLIAADGFDVD